MVALTIAEITAGAIGLADARAKGAAEHLARCPRCRRSRSIAAVADTSDISSQARAGQAGLSGDEGLRREVVR